eukprot:gb/GEZN01000843.1/.p1 GENE.gb/GEZN01000843.1/~~gb/GEZN01000843.1/.p1  ORF type:complete len:1167 (-),score=102.88 gb/GEZN01000843.1/:115-3309(-)
MSSSSQLVCIGSAQARGILAAQSNSKLNLTPPKYRNRRQRFYKKLHENSPSLDVSSVLGSSITVGAGISQAQENLGPTLSCTSLVPSVTPLERASNVQGKNLCLSSFTSKSLHTPKLNLREISRANGTERAAICLQKRPQSSLLSKLGHPATSLSAAEAANVGKVILTMTFWAAVNYVFPSSDGCPFGRGWDSVREDLLYRSPSVATIPISWIRKHYQQVVYKCGCLERAYPRQLSGRKLTYANVVSQLEYRAQREAAGHHPALLSILEEKQPPERYMILFVSRILSSSVVGRHTQKGFKSTDMELSDGWDTIHAYCDDGLRELLRRGSISVGQKLRVFGAKLILKSGDLSPEAQPASALQLAINGVRRARWNAVLGHQRSSVFSVCISSLRVNAGVVPLVRGIVTRRSPILYYFKSADGRRRGFNHLATVQADVSFSQRNGKERFDKIASESEVTPYVVVILREICPATPNSDEVTFQLKNHQSFQLGPNEFLTTIWVPSLETLQFYHEGNLVEIYGTNVQQAGNYCVSASQSGSYTEGRNILCKLRHDRKSWSRSVELHDGSSLLAHQAFSQLWRSDNAIPTLACLDKGTAHDTVGYVVGTVDSKSADPKRLQVFIAGPCFDMLLVLFSESMEERHFLPPNSSSVVFCNLIYTGYDSNFHLHHATTSLRTEILSGQDVFSRSCQGVNRDYMFFDNLKTTLQRLQKWQKRQSGQRIISMQKERAQRIINQSLAPSVWKSLYGKDKEIQTVSPMLQIVGMLSPSNFEDATAFEFLTPLQGFAGVRADDATRNGNLNMTANSIARDPAAKITLPGKQLLPSIRLEHKAIPAKKDIDLPTYEADFALALALMSPHARVTLLSAELDQPRDWTLELDLFGLRQLVNAAWIPSPSTIALTSLRQTDAPETVECAKSMHALDVWIRALGPPLLGGSDRFVRLSEIFANSRKDCFLRISSGFSFSNDALAVLNSADMLIFILCSAVVISPSELSSIDGGSYCESHVQQVIQGKAQCGLGFAVGFLEQEWAFFSKLLRSVFTSQTLQVQLGSKWLSSDGPIWIPRRIQCQQ